VKPTDLLLRLRSPVILEQTLEPEVSSAKERLSPVKRVVSVDIFRGLNILLMIFVNNVAEVRGLPWWTYHRGDINGMTYVDMVFPGFLFLMGMAIPLAVDARVARGQSKMEIWGHVVWRAVSLLVLGLFIANASHVDAQSTHITQVWWTLLGLVAITLAWVRFPGEEQHKALYRAMRYTGIVMIAGLFVVFRKITREGEIGRLDFSYVEILGLLGWAYLLVSGLYLLFAKRREILVGTFAVMVVLNTFSTMGWLRWMGGGPVQWNPFEAGLSSMTMAGVLASFVIVGNAVAPGFRQKARSILVTAGVLFAVGFTLQPLGISKNRDTPTWCLYCTAANLLVALALYWLADVKGWKGWAKFANSAGANPLLPYMLAYVPFLLPPLYWLSAMGTSGAWGLGKSVALTGMVLLITRALLRFGVTLRV
jgi:heparan-alpha-glucosaminide N-acetyltransferase